jgi:hypothetical protein
MDREKRKSKAIIRVEFLDSTTEQTLLGSYLKDSGESKGHVMEAVTAYFLPFALAKNTSATKQELEFEARKSRRKLLNQVATLDDFFRINHQIDLTSDLPGDGKNGEMKSPSQSLQHLPISIASTASPSNLSNTSVDDEDDDDDCEVGTNNFQFFN